MPRGREGEDDHQACRQGIFYRQLAAYGQVGRVDLDLPWESVDQADSLRG